VLSSPHLASTFRPVLDGRRGNPTVVWITETEPLDTGGAIVNALAALDTDEPFLALNGDILTDLDLTAMVAAHDERSAAATIALTHVEDARAFGLVSTSSDGRVLEFREKPEDPIPGDVNAGTYVLTPRALGGWPPGRAVSIERDIFPSLIDHDRVVHGFVSDAYWLDLGTPEKYLQANFDLLDGRVRDAPTYPAPFVADGASVDARAHLGRWVVVGEGARIGRDAQIEDSVLLPSAVVEAGAGVTGSILGAGSTVGPGARIRGSVVAGGAVVRAGAELDGARISAGQVPRSAEGAGPAQPVG
jgi:mannose-1-phosphate guanylyltransferase